MSIIINIYQARDGSFEVSFQSEDEYAFKCSIETLKNFIKPQFRRYQPTLKRWHISDAAAPSFHNWIGYLRGYLGATPLWSQEDEPSRATAPAQGEDAYAALHLLPSAPPELIKAAYRTLAKLHHPDHGGDEAKMKALNAAFEKLAA
jgi:hypothetical protein